jgi:hypothetical protein
MDGSSLDVAWGNGSTEPRFCVAQYLFCDSASKDGFVKSSVLASLERASAIVLTTSLDPKWNDRRARLFLASDELQNNRP